jgi:hypothetical protein
MIPVGMTKREMNERRCLTKYETKAVWWFLGNQYGRRDWSFDALLEALAKIDVEKVVAQYREQGRRKIRRRAA